MPDANSTADINTRFLNDLFSLLLGRWPSAAELAYGLGQLGTGRDPRDYYFELAESGEAKARRTSHVDVPLFVPPGHFYSPIVNVRELRAAGTLDAARNRPLLDVELDPARFLAHYERLARHFDSVAFPESRNEEFRYFFDNGFYSYGDALVLSATVREFAPRQIVEVGSGFSSAVILDTLDRCSHAHDTRCTFIEPYPERLRSLLRDEDASRVRILETGIQTVDLRLLEDLEANDILFFDTTHISRTGSDVNHEVFEILPRLKPGVLIHFHDIFDRFEYPDLWILQDNRSWNEIYLLRAFLMNNKTYEVVFFNHAFASGCAHEARAVSPLFMKNPGGGLWLRKKH